MGGGRERVHVRRGNPIGNRGRRRGVRAVLRRGGNCIYVGSCTNRTTPKSSDKGRPPRTSRRPTVPNDFKVTVMMEGPASHPPKPICLAMSMLYS